MAKKFKVSLEGVGTKETGLARKEYGPFRCGSCAWLDWGHGEKAKSHCEHPAVLADPEVPKTDGKALVDQSDCCNRFRPTRKLEEVTFESVGL